MFDTSIVTSLRGGGVSPEMDLLSRLAKHGQVRLLMPEMAYREAVAQRENDASEAISQLAKALRRIAHNTLVARTAPIDQALASGAADKDAVRDAEDRSAARVKDWLSGLGVSAIPLTESDLRSGVDHYFAGSGPMGGIRNRNDLPDAFVFAGLKRLHSDNAAVVFVCNDGRLGRAATVAGITTVTSLPELLQLPQIAALHADVDFAQWWTEHFRTVVAAVRASVETVLGTQTDATFHLVAAFEEKLASRVSSTEVQDPSIPSDNCDAYVDAVSLCEAPEIDWDNAEPIGEGIISAPIAFEAGLSLSFPVFLGDLASLPEWVHGSPSDWSNHYFAASGSRAGRFEGRLVIGVTDECAKLGYKPDLLEMGFELEDVEFLGLVDA